MANCHCCPLKKNFPVHPCSICSCFTKMVWWRYLKQLSTYFKQPSILMRTHYTGQQGCTWFSAARNRTCHHYLPSFCCKYCHCYFSFTIKSAFITTFKTILILINTLILVINACHVFTVSIVTVTTVMSVSLASSGFYDHHLDDYNTYHVYCHRCQRH